ncbi:hypothetical protein D9611_011742 [Ephemerocybe angulata]|uniref:Uncharacterized protein n=1 Tax=Ephemerocybe angulata TaxID=980116 RepID=A0A8H5C508_9AGAR|nr:hypothetical protein D9611_011742 [Tulosesus angulatus]
MRVSILSIFSLTLALANFVSAHSDDTLNAREYVDDLSVRETSADVLADISTRDLISELSDRLERRGGELLKCPHCPRQFVNPNNRISFPLLPLLPTPPSPSLSSLSFSLLPSPSLSPRSCPLSSRPPYSSYPPNPSEHFQNTNIIQITNTTQRTLKTAQTIRANETGDGEASRRSLGEVDEAFFDAHFETNVKVPMFMCKRAAEVMPSPGGRIVLFSNSLTAASTVLPNALCYLATKGAVEQISRVLAKDLGSRGITVNTISPGPIDTPLFREGKSQHVIDGIAKQTPSRRLRPVTGLSHV